MKRFQAMWAFHNENVSGKAVQVKTVALARLFASLARCEAHLSKSRRSHLPVRSITAQRRLSHQNVSEHTLTFAGKSTLA